MLEFDFSDLIKLEQALSAAPDIFSQEMGIAMTQATDIFYGDFSTYPESPSYPINWDTPKQRKAFFASNGFRGGGIPHERMGAYPDSFQKSVVATPTEIKGSVLTTYADAQHIQGGSTWSPGQSNIHKGRWPTDKDVLEKERSAVDDLFKQALDRGVQKMASIIGK